MTRNATTFDGPDGPLTAREVFERACTAGDKAAQGCKPTPMVVQQHLNSADDSSPVVREWTVDEGVCGFAWCVLNCRSSANRRFLNGLRKAGLVESDPDAPVRGKPWARSRYYGGYLFWAPYGQVYERNRAYVAAFAEALAEYGVSVTPMARLD